MLAFGGLYFTSVAFLINVTAHVMNVIGLFASPHLIWLCLGALLARAVAMHSSPTIRAFRYFEKRAVQLTLPGVLFCNPRCL